MRVIQKSNPLPFAFFLLLLSFHTLYSQGQIKTASGETISYPAFDQLVTQQMDSLRIPGAAIAVINNGKIIYEKSYGYANIDSQTRVQQNTIFKAASMSKPVFAYFVLKMMQDGILHLDLDQPVYEYFPYPDIAYDDRYKLITARMLLTHTSGFPNWRENNIACSCDPLPTAGA